MGHRDEITAKKPAVRLWLIGGLLIVAGIVGRVVLHAADDGRGYPVVMLFQAGFYLPGLVVLGLWVLSDSRKTPTGRAVAVWLTAAVLCVVLTCASSPK